MQPYRSDVEALEARHAALEAELADRTRDRDEAARMLAEARAREREATIAADRASGGPERRRQRIMMLATMVAGCAIAGAVIAAAAAEPSRAERRFDQIAVQYEALTEELCACTAMECVTTVTTKMSNWAQAIAKDASPSDARIGRASLERFTKIGQRMAQCMDRLTGPPTPNRYNSQAGKH